MTPSKTLFYLCISFVLGIFLESLIRIPQIFIWGILFSGVLVIFSSFVIRVNSLRFRVNSFIAGFCILFLVLGILRFQIAEFNIANDKLKSLNDGSEKIILEGQIIGEPDIRDSFQRLKVKVDGSIILITAGRYPEYSYLDKVKITGKLKTPPEFEDFNYKNYLLKDGITSLMDFPKIELISKRHNYNTFSFLYEKVLFLKEKLSLSINSNFSSPQNFILKGIVFGKDSDWPRGLKNKFNATGLSHITAVSGSNIVILTNTLVIVLLAFGLWRQQALYFSIILVWMYIILVGLPASGVRAGIMGSIFLFAQIFGRQNTSSRTIVLAGTLMILQNPLLLRYDVGFQLSFLASMGIIHLKPLLDMLFELIKTSTANLKALKLVVLVFADKKSKIKDILGKSLKALADIVSVTLSAQILIMPVIIYNFGAVSLVSPLTNLLILPIVPFLMVFGFLASIFGIFSGFLGWVFALPCYVVIFYLLKVLDIFHQPWAVKSFQNIYWFWFLVYYLILFMLIKFMQKKLKPKFLGY